MSRVRLGSIARIFNGNSISKAEKEKHYRRVDGIPYIGTAEVGFDTEIDYEAGVAIPKDKEALFKIACAGTPLVCAEGGSAGRKVGFLKRKACFGNKLFAVDPNTDWEGKFLFYYFLSDDFREQFNSMSTGLIGGVSIKKFKEIEVPQFSQEEQRRIVAVLDKAFTTITAATANTETNLANARELFESYLTDKFSDTNLVTLPLSEVCLPNRIITYGVIKLGQHVDDGIPCLRTSNVRWLDIETDGMKLISSALSQEYRRTVLQGGEVLVNVRGTLGGVAVVSPTMRGWNVSREVAVVPADYEKVIPEYLAYWIGTEASQSWLTGVEKGLAYSGINISDLRTLPVPIKSLSEQQKIADELDVFKSAAYALERIYAKKLKALVNLRQSLLQKAFAGELTTNPQVTVSTDVSSANDDSFTTPAFTANVIAFAYRRHVAEGKEKTFGRVKAQKSLHLCESIGGIDLGRRPIKDAAGPNDFQHMLAAEGWAESERFFKFEQRPSGKGYDFVKLARFDQMMSQGLAQLNSVKAALENAIAPLIALNSEQAELLATVHAAWNNLILDGAEPTDAAIIFEARDNWHADKMKFSDAKFLEAVRAIRAKSIEPDGSAKRVGGQERLI